MAVFEGVHVGVRAALGLRRVLTHSLQLLAKILSVLHAGHLGRGVLRGLREAEDLGELLVERCQVGHGSPRVDCRSPARLPP